MARKKDTPVPFSVIPQVPKDFDGAVAANAQAKKGIAFWQAQKDAAMFESQQNEANLMLKKWRRVSQEAADVIQAYQPKLF